MESFIYGNGIERTVTHNTRGLPQQVTDQRFGVAVFDEQYSWDPNGNLESQTDWLNTPAGTRWLGYDGRDRLTSSWISGYGNESFGWDAFDRLRWRNTWSGAEAFDYRPRNRGSEYLFLSDAPGIGGPGIGGQSTFFYPGIGGQGTFFGPK